MKKYIKENWLTIVIVIVILAAIVAWYAVSRFIVPNVASTSTGTSQVANPASVNCVTTLGGTLEMREETVGTTGYCHLPDGRVCEEWSLLRGSCTASSQ